MAALAAAAQFTPDHTRQGASDAQVSAQLAAQQQMIEAEQQRVRRERLDLLREAAATQRARSGAMTGGAGGGSADALIEGLARRTFDALAEDDRRYAALAAARAAGARRANLLEDDGQALEAVKTGFSIFQSFYGS